MHYWKRTLALVMILAMLASLGLPAAAQEEYEAITVGDEIAVTVDYDTSKMFAFTPEESGWYAFYSTDYEGDPKGSIHDANMNELGNDDDSGEGWNFRLSWEAVAGETYYLEARGEGSYTVRVEKMVKATGMELEYGVTSGFPNPDILHCDKVVTFQPENAIPESITWVSSDPEVVWVSPDGDYVFEAPGTATVTATSEGGLTASWTFTVYPINEIRCGEAVSAVLEWQECMLRFVPEESGWYGFYSTGNIDTYGEIQNYFHEYLDSNDDNGETANFFTAAELTAGKTYYLYSSWWYGDYVSNASLALYVTPLEAPEALTLSRESIVGYPGGDVWLDYSFQPMLSIPEEVTFTSSNEAVAAVDAYGNVELLAVGEAVITVTSESGLIATCPVTVSDTPTVTCNEVYRPDLQAEDCLLKFVPQESGWYTFYSTGYNADAGVGILTEEKEQIVYNWYQGIDNHYIVSAELTAGELYYLESHWYANNDGQSSVELTVIPSPEATSIELTNLPVIGVPGETCFVGNFLEPIFARPQAVTYTCADESIATVDQDGNIELLNPGVTEITVSTESGLSQTFPVTVRSIGTITSTQPPYTPVLEDRECTLKFVPEETGWYGFYSTGERVDPWGEISAANGEQLAYNGDNGIDSHFMAAAMLTAGETYFLHSGWWCYGSGEDSTLELLVRPLEAAQSITLNYQSISDYPGSSFGLETFFQPLLSIPEEVTFTSSNEAVATVGSYGNLELLSPGEAVITATSESGLTASFPVTVKAIQPIALGQVVTPDVLEGDCMLSFVPEESGWYGFYAEGEYVDSWGYLLDQNYNQWDYDSDSAGNNQFLVAAELVAGETYYLEARWNVYDSENASIRLQVAPLAAAEGLTMNKETVYGFPGEWHGIYAFFQPILSIPEEITYSSSDMQVVTVNRYGEMNLVAPGTAVITATSENGLTATCTVTVKETYQLEVGETMDFNEAEGENRIYFTPEETGLYHIFTTGEDACIRATIKVVGDYISHSYSGGGDGDNVSFYRQLTGGQEYELRLNPINSDGTADYTLHIEKAVAVTEIVLSHDSYTGAPGDSFWLEGTVLPENADRPDLYFSSSDQNVATVSYYDGYVRLQNEGTAVITVSTLDGVTATCTVTAAYPEGETIPYDQEVTLCEADGAQWFKFVPEESGWYRFYSTGGNDVDPYGEIYDSDRNWLVDSDDANDMQFNACWNMTAGETYYLRVSFYDGGNATCTVRIQKQVPATELVLDRTELSGTAGGNAWLNATLLPQHCAAEELTWSSSNENVVTVEQDGYLTFMGEGEAVITVTSENGLQAQCSVTVQLPPVLELGVPVELDAENGTALHRFIPAESGCYGFFTAGNVDTVGYLYNDAMELLTDDDDGAEGYNYQVVYELEAGKTYYLRTSYYDYGVTGTYTLCVEKVKEASRIELHYDELYMYEGYTSWVSYELLPIPCFPEDVTWSSSDETVVSFYYEMGGAELFAEGVGTAVVTVTTDSGLTDTVTVTVVPRPMDADEYGRCGSNLLWRLDGDVMTISGSGDMFDEYIMYGEYTQVQLPEGLTRIGEYCFVERLLTEVTIPSTVTGIGRSAFADNEDLAVIRFTGSAPVMEENAFENVTATAYYPANDPSWTEEVRQSYGGNLTWVSYEPGSDEPGGEVPAGVTVSGTITSASDGDITVELAQDGNVVAVATVSGKTGTYSFDNVPAGEYTLWISKVNHVTRDYPVTVGTEAVTQDGKICLIGDVTGDGRVNVGDVVRLYAYIRGSAEITDEYALACANVNGGRLNIGDTVTLYAHCRGTKPLY